MPDQSRIAGLFPACVATACCRITDDGLMLYPQEQELMHKAVEKRCHEFAAGRTCARDALGSLGIAAAPILRNDLAAPLWPEGIVGAISHSHTWAGAAVARRSDLAGIGLDIETVERLSMNIARKVLTPAEAAVLSCSPASRHKELLALAFSAKESVYKCLSCLVDSQMGFQDAEVRVTGPLSFEIRMSTAISRALPACRCLTGRYFMHEGCVFTGIFLAA
jgi:enterobactin synthetase component D